MFSDLLVIQFDGQQCCHEQKSGETPPLVFITDVKKGF